LQALPLLESLSFRDRFEVIDAYTPEALETAIDSHAHRIAAIVTGAGKGVRPDLWDRLPALKLVAVNGVGTDSIDLDKAAECGVEVSLTTSEVTEDTADLAICLWLAVKRRLVPYDRYVRADRWRTEGDPPLARKASGSKVGIVGLGRIGSAIAARAAPFAGEIRYHSRQPKPAPYGYFDTIESLATWSDVLFVAASGDAAKIIGGREIAALGPDGVLINIARGRVVDQPALVAALKSGALGGAGLDVFTDEPDVPAELFDLDTVVLQPHMGSATAETRGAMAAAVLQSLDDHFYR
jgi:lactate dehydrogenase-like 2-hydroxyacid dehydrogenase